MIVYDPIRCIHCGACQVHCPHGAIAIDTMDFMVFSQDRCLQCGSCLDACPCGALHEVSTHV